MQKRTFFSFLLCFTLLLSFAPSYLIGITPTVQASSSFELGKTPFYGKVPSLNQYSKVTFWYGTIDQQRMNQLKGFDLVILEPTLRVNNIGDNHFYSETLTSAQVQELRSGTDGILGTTDDVIVLGYISIGEMLSTIIPGSSGHMTVQRGIELGLLPQGYSGPSGPLHGPNPWNYSSNGAYINVEGGALPDGTYNDGYNQYTNLEIASNYSSWGSLLSWRNNGLMPWYLDQQGTWVNDNRYLYGGYWKDGDGQADVNPSYGGGYVNGGDPAWQKFVTYQIDKLVHDLGYDGVFLDTVDTPDPVGGASPSLSWGPRGNFGFTAEGMIELVEAIKAVNPAKIVAANRAYWYFNPDEGTSQFADRYRKAINIFVTESWYHNAYINQGSKFYDENPAFSDNWNTDPNSSSYRNRDNFGGFWKEYMNAHANQPDGFNTIIIDFMVASNQVDKWMSEVVENSGYMGYIVSGSTHFNTAIYDTSKNWLAAKGYSGPNKAGMNPTDLYDGFAADGNFSEWNAISPIYTDPSGTNSKGITSVKVEFVDDKFFMMVESNSTLDLNQEMIYFDFDANGPSGWDVWWPVTPDARIYFENMNKAYLVPHTGPGDVFRFDSSYAPGNNGWPVRAKQFGNKAEFEFKSDYIFPSDTMAGEEVWVWFRQANFGGSSVAFTVPNSGPRISNVQATAVQDHNAIISWTTDVPSSSTVNYGTTTAYGNTAVGPNQVTQHSIQLNNLTPGTTYHFKVTSQDSNGLSSSNNFTFTTTNSMAPPIISNIQVLNRTTNSATIQWSTNTATTGILQYGTTSAYGSTLTSGASSNHHSITLNNLNPGTTYHFQITATTNNQLSTISPSQTFMTETESLYPAITIDGTSSDWANISTLASGNTTVHSMKATNDENYLYLLIEGTNLDTLAQFYINADNQTSTGYNATGWDTNGSDYLLENNFLYRHQGSGWSWTSLGALSYAKNNSVIEAAVPLSSLQIQPGSTIRIGFLKNNSTTERLPAPNSEFPTFTLLNNGNGHSGSDPVIDGSASDWSSINVLANGSSSISTLKAHHNEDHLYLLVQGGGLDVSGAFYINADNNNATGYNATDWLANGADYLLENNILYVYSGSNNSWSWTPVATLSSNQFARNASVVETAIPLSLLQIGAGDTIRVGYIKLGSVTERLPGQNQSLPSYQLD